MQTVRDWFHRVLLPSHTTEECRPVLNAAGLADLPPGDVVTLAARAAERAGVRVPELDREMSKRAAPDAARGEAAMGALLAILVVICTLATSGSGCGWNEAAGAPTVMERRTQQVGPWWQAEHSRLIQDLRRSG